MAARTNRPNHTDEVREKIRVSQLLNRLHNHVFGKDEDETQKVEISQTQMKAIEILLKKSLPDLSQIDLAAELSGKVDVTGTLIIQESSADQSTS